MENRSLKFWRQIKKKKKKRKRKRGRAQGQKGKRKTFFFFLRNAEFAKNNKEPRSGMAGEGKEKKRYVVRRGHLTAGSDSTDAHFI